MKGSIAMIAVLMLTAAGAPVAAQGPGLDAATRTKVIDSLLAKLNATYVFPEVAGKMDRAIRERVGKKEYDAIESGPDLARKLTDDLQAVSHDLHLRVSYSATPRPPRAEDATPSPEEIAREKKWAESVNQGFEKVERLPGNIGYLSLRGFLDPGAAGEVCAAAMNFLSGTDALILDLRNNGGGDPAMVAVLCSYFFDQPTHLNDLYFRPTDTTQQYWTLPYVPGKRYVGKEIYVLTSRRTFSGAEECSYNLKTQKRATLIGETTGGGAHPGGVERIDDHFGVFVPNGRAINPITKTNWEGTGVAPDMAVSAARALLTAQQTALKKLIADTKDPGLLEERKVALKEAEDELARFQPVTFHLKGHADAARVTLAGTFNQWDGRGIALKKEGDGWSATVDLLPGRHAYKFVVDGKWMVDPDNTAKVEDGNGQTNSLRLVAEK